MSKVKYCKYCRNHPEFCKQVIFPGYTNFWEETAYVCPFCNNPIVDTVIDSEDMDTLSNVSNDISFLEAMIDLKQKDPIEFQLKMSQFKVTQSQTKVTEEESNAPRCPTCLSTNITRITTTAKVANIVMFGLLGNQRKKTFHCNSCKYEW